MGNSPTPPGLLERILLEVDKRIASFARSGFLRNATISDGGLTIRGGFFRMLAGLANVQMFYLGPSGPVLGDGTVQQIWQIRRAGGQLVLDLYDAFPGVDGTLNQALNWRDRNGNAVIADDTDSGQGIARPYLPGVFYPARNVDWPKVTNTSFETVFRAQVPKQQPKLYVRAWGWNDTAGATGEIKVLVNGIQLSTTVTTGNAAVTEYLFGPAAVDGAHLSSLVVEIQARMVSGGGSLQVGAAQVQSRQT